MIIAQQVPIIFKMFNPLGYTILKNISEYNETFLANFHKRIRLFRNQRREGLIRSRAIGAKNYARGNFFFFLDSHCEVNSGWLEPLLAILIEQPGVVASPVIDVIDPITFRYRSGSATLRGGFNWALEFQWIQMPPKEIRNINPTKPFT